MHLNNFALSQEQKIQKIILDNLSMFKYTTFHDTLLEYILIPIRVQFHSTKDQKFVENRHVTWSMSSYHTL